MDNMRKNALKIMRVAVAIFAMAAINQASAATEEALDKDSMQALQTLYDTQAASKALSQTAKAGLVFGGGYGEGVARNLSTSSLKDDAFAFILSQQGLMAGVSIEGTNISRIDR